MYISWVTPMEFGGKEQLAAIAWKGQRWIHTALLAILSFLTMERYPTRGKGNQRMERVRAQHLAGLSVNASSCGPLEKARPS